MNRFIASLLALPAGMLVVYLALSAVCGGFENANVVLFVSIVCTFGVGLLFWLPLSWLVSWGIVSIAVSFQKRAITTETKQRADSTAEDRLVGAYIKEAQRNGLDPRRISAMLRRNGWSDASIQRAWEASMMH